MSLPLHIKARLISLGGGILAALGVFLSVMFLVSFWLPRVPWAARLVIFGLLILLIVYTAAGWLERLSFDGKKIIFRNWRGERAVNPAEAAEILFVHQGLNLEHGIESLLFRDAHGDILERFDLGPLWRRRDLEPFLHEIEKVSGRAKLVQEVR